MGSVEIDLEITLTDSNSTESNIVYLIDQEVNFKEGVSMVEEKDLVKIKFTVVETLSIESIIGLDKFWDLGIIIDGRKKTLQYKNKIK